MAHQEQNGSGQGSEAGSGPEAEEHVEPGASEGGPEEFEEAATVRGSVAPAPSPREQWFGGFEGEAPPPPPYARMPEDTPFPLPPGSGPREAAPADGAGDTGGEVGGEAEPEVPEGPEASVFREVPEVAESPGATEDSDGSENSDASDDSEDEVRGATVRLMPGASRRRPQRPGRPQRQRLQRPARPGGEDPLAPRRSRRDSDVPEPEQLPPLETERDGPLAGPSGPVSGPRPGPAQETDPDQGPGPVRGTDPGQETNPERGTGPATGTEPGSPPGGGHPAPGVPPAPAPGEPSRPVPPHAPEPPPALTGPRADLAPPPAAPASSGPPVQRRTDQDRQTSDALNAATLVRNRRQGPSGGWRRAVHTATLGLINPGESAKVLRERELVARASTPVASGHHRVAVLSLKGGVGKTTTTVALGATLASLRGDRVLAVDANPDRGTLSDKVRLETAATIRDLLNERHLVSRYADIRGFTSQAPSRLEILASDRDPAVSEAFSDADYREVSRIVEHFYSICITDCGTGLLHSAMRGVLGLADQVVLVSSASVDGARSASATLDWLEAHGHGALVGNAVVVLSMVRSNSKSSVDLNRLEEHFAGRCRDVVRVPWDGHLEEGAEVDLEQLAPATRDAYLQLAATVGEAFARRG
ncbi:nucleotide-binding protein [Nocardiopsis halotolerans]|uniref:nucleotide-binding protein n=1 Tax=Nocardiopsis halotolerans TaxID=124252 RepID=UPI000345D9FC|nr:AAA family ATPase [Nocardiopsis halotolerans]